MRFWFLVFLLIIGTWLYYLVKPYFSSPDKKAARRMHDNLRQELKGTEWQMEDGRIGKFHDVEDSGRTFVLTLADGKKVKVAYLKLTRHEKKNRPGLDDIVTEIR
jgi:preprotein translocase subunit YajC